MDTALHHTSWRRGLLGAALLSLALLPAARAHADGAAPQPGRYTATTATNLRGAHAFPAPPAGFDPTTASTADLGRYGFPLPPDATKNAVQYRHWMRIMHQARRYVRPFFVTHPHRRHHLLPRNNVGSSNWSGSVVTGQTNSFGAAQSEWVVPNVDASNLGTYSSVWVGLDGWGNGQVEQLGTEQEPGFFGSTYYAWVELYPDPEQQISLPVAPGQTVYSYLYYDAGANQVYFFMENESTSQYTSFTWNATYGAPGQSAEWVVEAPTVGGGQTSPANFGEVFMADMSVWSPSSGWYSGNNNPFSPTQVDMYNGSDQLDSTTVLGDTTDEVTWLAYS